MRANAWLIRHGQSQANAGAATQHPSTIDLTDLGRAQAQHIAETVTSVPHRIVVSPFQRTLLTAQPLIQRFLQEGKQVPVLEWPLQEFTYLSPVRCKGTTAADRQVWAKAYWERADPDWEDGDGAESYRQLMHRVERLSDQLAEQVGLSFVFGHGMFFKAFVIGLTHGWDATPKAMTRYRALESAAPIHNATILRLAPAGASSWTVLEDASHAA
jgi:2,3-bisphosphoglycerate-dependent phosphoglycerate mutase